MAIWHNLAEQRPELAAVAEQLFLLNQPDAPGPAGLCYLATIRRDGGPRIHPISPVLLTGHLYAFILKASPKCRDLLRDSRYALHSWPRPFEPDGFNDEEFYLTGQASLVEDTLLAQNVASACGDNITNGAVFELHLERALHKSREQGKVIYTRWKAG